VWEQYKYFAEFLEQIREDWSVYQRDWTRPGFRAVAVHRLGVWLRNVRPKVLRAPLSIFHRMMYRYVRNHYGIELPSTTIVGCRFIIAHQGGIVIHPHAEIGDDCLIRQNVTIGAVSNDRWWEAPKLGHRVQVGCGAAILGKVVIGDGTRIGPNAVVMTNVPAGAIVFVTPSRIIRLQKTQEVGNKDGGDGSLARTR